VRLRFDPQTEISIYRSVPHLTPGWPPALKIPLAMVRGRDSRVVLPHHAYLLRLMARGEAHTLPGGHMFPFERPQQTADKLRELLARWGTHGELTEGVA
jgi:pimeloyl-ACP methyl ester carboxylesterase